MFLLQCCGVGRRSSGTRPGQSSGRPVKLPDERTPLLIDTTDELPFVPAPAAEPIDDEALLEYQRRVERIIDEVAEKLVSVTSGRVPPTPTRSNASRWTSPTSDSHLHSRNRRLRGESSSSQSSAHPSGHSPQDRLSSSSSKASSSRRRSSSRLGDSDDEDARPRRRSHGHNGPSSDLDGEQTTDFEQAYSSGPEEALEAGLSDDVDTDDDEHGGKTPKAGYANHMTSSADLAQTKGKHITERKPSNAVDRLDDLLSLPHDDFAKLIAPS